MPNTDAGLPFTSMLRRSIRNTVGGALVPLALVWGAVCARASAPVVEAATAESSNARRESMGQGLFAHRRVAAPGGSGRGYRLSALR
jgi:lysylphosphatidylglycerol synthetase-like protein (DUF2156 family)